VVRPPTREGFGTKLLMRGIARTLDGTATLDYPRDGLRFHLEFPLNGTVSQ
jgi:two-component sensor histidine kinase